MKFSELSLNENLFKGIEKASYVNCTEVQEKVYQKAIEGKDLYVQSQTGTGKTASYLVPIIQLLLTSEKTKQALIMVPTRELAVQVKDEIKKLGEFTNLRSECFYGGVGYEKQIAALKKGVDILIGTPGRLIDLSESNQLDLSKVAYLVVDEADRMFDMGFYPDLRTLIKVLPNSEKRQTMLFSATLNSYVKNLAWEYTRDPEEITIEAENITVEQINQQLLHVSSDDKIRLLLGIISKENPESLIIFTNTKKTCEILSKRLTINGISNEYLIGDLPQSKRIQIMNQFKAKKIKCLVATDVAARGIDVNDLQMVINYDLPTEVENYVHRIGRTARAGKSGRAYTLCSEQDVYSLPPIERYIEMKIPSSVAMDDMMIEDKSKNQYIRLESEKKNDNKGHGKYSSKNQQKSKEYKRDRRVYSSEEKVDLSSMTSEERMEYYKKKYSQGSKPSNYSKNSSNKNSKNNSKGKKNSSNYSNKNNKNYNNSSKNNTKNYSKSGKKNPSGNSNKKQNKGIFAKIKNLFSGRK